jgi:Rieske Fe-S protein
MELANTNVVIDLSKVASGQMVIAEYVGRGIYVYRRTKQDITEITNATAGNFADADGKYFRDSILRVYRYSSEEPWSRLLLSAKDIATNFPFRSLNQEFLVVGNWSPESGCALSHIEAGRRAQKGMLFVDPCSKAVFDAAGRIFAGELSLNGKKRAARHNLSVPPYRFSGKKLIIGPAAGEELPKLGFSKSELYHDQDPTQLLIAAASFNDIESVRLAIRRGAQVNYWMGGGAPIDAAILGGSIEVIRELLKHGARPTHNSSMFLNLMGRQDVAVLLKLAM